MGLKHNTTILKKEQIMKQEDPTNPTYYRDFDGVENIQVAERLNFLLGNAEKYIVRAGDKNRDTLVEDLQKAVWYLERQKSTMVNESASLEFDLTGIEWKKIAWKLPHNRSQAMFHLLNGDICRIDDIDLAIYYIRLDIEANTPGRAELIK